MPVKNHISCPFCNESILLSVFYTQKDFLGAYNIAPVLPGHSLIIPKKHVISITELNDHELFGFFNTARKVLAILMKAFHTDAFDWSLQEKPEAGQTIEHLHLHIVPRTKYDLQNPGDWYPLLQNNDSQIIDSLDRPRLTTENLHQIVNKLRSISDAIN